jgi:hypothetical protein
VPKARQKIHSQPILNISSTKVELLCGAYIFSKCRSVILSVIGIEGLICSYTKLPNAIKPSTLSVSNVKLVIDSMQMKNIWVLYLILLEKLHAVGIGAIGA